MGMGLRAARAGVAGIVVISAALAACAAEPTPPEPDVTIAPAEDYGVNVQRCMTEFGWKVEVEWDGGVSSEVTPRDQMEKYTADLQKCHKRFGYDRLPEPPTYEEAARLYDAYLEVADCVRELGFYVPDPPSRNDYAERLASGGIAPWHPYPAPTGDVSIEDVRRMNEECPAP